MNMATYAYGAYGVPMTRPSGAAPTGGGMSVAGRMSLAEKRARVAASQAAARLVQTTAPPMQPGLEAGVPVQTDDLIVMEKPPMPLWAKALVALAVLGLGAAAYKAYTKKK